MLEQGPTVIPANPAGPEALLGRSQYEMLPTDARINQLPLRALDCARDLVDQQVLFDDQADKDRSGGEPLRGRIHAREYRLSQLRLLLRVVEHDEPPRLHVVGRRRTTGRFEADLDFIPFHRPIREPAHRPPRPAELQELRVHKRILPQRHGGEKSKGKSQSGLSVLTSGI